MTTDVARLARELAGDGRVVHHVTQPARRRRTRRVPDDLPAAVAAALERAGIADLHAFQAEGIAALRARRHVVLAGGTGSGKSLCYQLPILEALLAPSGVGADADGSVGGRKQTALYLAPTKALAQDQARRLRELEARWARPQLYDGDTSPQQRAVIRRTANLLLTNPDMLSAGILPRHGEWATFLRGLAFVVVDEAHVYRGVFGSHVAQVLRRLRRLLEHYGNHDAAFCLSSATIGNPVQHARRLAALDQVQLVDDAGAPQAARELVLWNPELDEETDERDSALGDASRIYADLLAQGVATIVFARSRKSCELIHRFTRKRLESMGLHDVAARIAPYRAGYTPEERRATERALADGELLGVVATSALELGIDIGSLQASMVVTFPGTVTSLRQRWGRAGRTAGGRGLCLLVAGEDALDQYFMRHPQELLEREVEHAIVSTRNPRIVVPHLAAAAAELPLAGDVDEQLFAGVLEQGVAQLLDGGECARTKAGVQFVGRRHAAGSISLRSTGRGDVAIVDTDAGQLLGTVEVGRAATSVHPGAVYLHRGREYFVEALDTDRLMAFVRPRTMPFYTMPKVDTDIEVTGLVTRRALPGTDVELCFGTLVVTDQLVGYQRLDAQTHRVMDLVHQALPPLAFETEGVWIAAPGDALHALAPDQLLGALHAAEHGLIAMMPLIATCDRWDVGGLSIDWHAAFEGPGIFVYDGHAGGVGICEAAYERFERWARAARDAIVECPCEDGCPSCVQSPKCGNLNEPLDKHGAGIVLAAALGQGVPA